MLQWLEFLVIAGLISLLNDQGISENDVRAEERYASELEGIISSNLARNQPPVDRATLGYFEKRYNASGISALKACVGKWRKKAGIFPTWNDTRDFQSEFLYQMTNESDVRKFMQMLQSAPKKSSSVMEKPIGMDNTFLDGDLVEYNSTKGWVNAKVTSVSRSGLINLNIKRCVHPSQVRYRPSSDPVAKLEKLRKTRDLLENLHFDGDHKRNLSVQYAKWRALENLPSTSELEEAEFLAQPFEWPLLDGFRAQCNLCSGLVVPQEFLSKKERREWGISQVCGPCQRNFLYKVIYV